MSSARHLRGLPERFALLRIAGFRGSWLSGALASVARWLDMLVAGVVMFDLTDSAFQVALVTMARMLPLALFGATAGVLVERLDRRRLLIFAGSGLALLLIVMTVVAYSGGIRAWHLHGVAFVTGTFWVIDFSARRTLLADLVGPAQVGIAMSLESVTNNGTRLLGPLAGGFLLQELGLAGAYVLGALLHLAYVAGIATVPVPARIAGDAAGGVLRAVAEGLQVVRSEPLLVSLLLVTVVFNLFAFPSMTMLPVIGKETLGLGAFEVGVLTSAEGIGALLGASALAVAAPMRLFRRFYVFGVLAFLSAMLTFSQAPTALFAGTCLLIGGLGGAAFASMQSTLMLLNSRPAMRGRVMGVLSMCIGTAPIGFAYVGLLAEWLGAPQAVAWMAVQGIVALALLTYFSPALLKPQLLPAAPLTA